MRDVCQHFGTACAQPRGGVSGGSTEARHGGSPLASRSLFTPSVRSKRGLVPGGPIYPPPRVQSSTSRRARKRARPCSPMQRHGVGRRGSSSSADLQVFSPLKSLWSVHTAACQSLVILPPRAPLAETRSKKERRWNPPRGGRSGGPSDFSCQPPPLCVIVKKQRAVSRRVFLFFSFFFFFF